MNLIIKVKTFFALGIPSVARNFIYRLGVRFNLNRVKKISFSIPEGGYFRLPENNEFAGIDANCDWNNQHCYFDWYKLSNSGIPDWHRNPFNAVKVKNSLNPWWTIDDFNSELGDIKTVWEGSRFNWVVAFAQMACKGDEASLQKLNDWLLDWVKNNPPYLGINWKCGQESSIRVMHLAVAALILDQVFSANAELLALVKAHLVRIAPTLSYAVSQNNNHGTSEAAALYIGGSWLVLLGDSDGIKFQKTGLKWLENRAACLVEEDGSFSQYSINYHRVMLDTYSLVEVWRRSLNLSQFSQLLYSRLGCASGWLYQFVQAKTGDVPNLGANDGARLLPLTASDYRDYRPSVQLAMALFENLCAWPEQGAWDIPLSWLRVEKPCSRALIATSIQFDKGGYSLLRHDKAFAVLRYPRFRYRPSQADSLHLDFWMDGENLLRDAGTYSYNAETEVIEYFSGTESHNTVQFDGRDQMSRLGRFLFGDWLKSKVVVPVEEAGDGVNAGAGYVDRYGASHYRKVFLSENMLKIEDKITGFKDKAVMRWRLQPGDWKLEGHSLYCDRFSMKISASMPIDDIELVGGWESRYYMLKTELPVLEISVSTPGLLITECKY